MSRYINSALQSIERPQDPLQPISSNVRKHAGDPREPGEHAGEILTMSGCEHAGDPYAITHSFKDVAASKQTF
jgi:hypothetical protein